MKFVVNYSAWDNGDYVVTIRPDFEKSWKSVPIGGTLSKEDARRVAEWLQSALSELWKIFENVAADAKRE
jgi:predicted rRNA methylase YqxC with S4 and FtsJ domains